MNPDTRLCWRCKKPFQPEQSFFWPNAKETCPECVSVFIISTVKAVDTVFRISPYVIQQAEEILYGKKEAK